MAVNIYTVGVTHTLMGVVEMELESIGRNIRKFRQEKKLRQEDLAEKTGLSTNYIGVIERGEKIPSLETLIYILNALGVSADLVMRDVLQTGYEVKCSLLSEKLEKLSAEDQARIYDIIDVFANHSARTKL